MISIALFNAALTALHNNDIDFTSSVFSPNLTGLTPQLYWISSGHASIFLAFGREGLKRKLLLALS